jgi:hypothetical protein
MGILDLSPVTSKAKRFFLGPGFTAGFSFIFGWLALFALLDTKCVDNKPVTDIPWNIMVILFFVVSFIRFLL